MNILIIDNKHDIDKHFKNENVHLSIANELKYDAIIHCFDSYIEIDEKK